MEEAAPWIEGYRWAHCPAHPGLEVSVDELNAFEPHFVIHQMGKEVGRLESGAVRGWIPEGEVDLICPGTSFLDRFTPILSKSLQEMVLAFWTDVVEGVRVATFFQGLRSSFKSVSWCLVEGGSVQPLEPSQLIGLDPRFFEEGQAVAFNRFRWLSRLYAMQLKRDPLSIEFELRPLTLSFRLESRRGRFVSDHTVNPLDPVGSLRDLCEPIHGKPARLGRLGVGHRSWGLEGDLDYIGVGIGEGSVVELEYTEGLGSMPVWFYNMMRQREAKVDVGKMGVKPGCNLMGMCGQEACQNSGKPVWVPQEFGIHSVSSEANKTPCPGCDQPLDTVQMCGFTDCYYVIRGQKRGEAEVFVLEGEVEAGKFLSFEGKAEPWEWLEIEARPRSKCLVQ